MFRHLFGVGLEEYMQWDYGRYLHHKSFAEAELKRRGVIGGE